MMTDVLDRIEPDASGQAPRATQTRNWRSETGDDGILHLWLDCEKTGTNLISRAVLEELDALLADIEVSGAKAVAIRSAKTNGFAAGADIDEFSKLGSEDAVAMLREGHRVLDRLAALRVPTIALIHGKTLGGGLELALACDIRIGIEGVEVGFPEVKLGLHPGLGGTFRLTALIDPLEAMQAMLTGGTIHDNKARKLGIVDALVPNRHAEAAIRAAASGKLRPDNNGLRAATLRTGAARSLAANRMRKESDRHAPHRHYPAPHALISLWEEHGGDAQEMQAAEIASFAELLRTETAGNLIRVFLLRRKLKQAADGTEDEISHVHVIGAGAMGAEIAAWCALRGKRVTIEDLDIERLGRVVKQAVEICESKHADAIGTRDTLDRLMPDPDRIGRARADLVIEAVPEKTEIKKQIYSELATEMKPEAILVSNTSSLRLSELADAVAAPERFAGLHFFNPVSKMQLVEIVAHDTSGQDTRARLARFVSAIGRLPVAVSDYPGFLVNRILTPYLLEAIVMLDEGYDKKTIDAAARAFGMPMGPLELADNVGLDICLDVAESLRDALDVPVAPIPDWLREMVEKGQTGKKSGHGFYIWSKGEKPGGDREDDPDADIIDRLVLPMCNAGVECLRHEVAKDADAIDAAMIFGTGWAPFRGGPMHYARKRGPEDVQARLNEFAGRYGDRFAPDPGWGKFA